MDIKMDIKNKAAFKKYTELLDGSDTLTMAQVGGLFTNITTNAAYNSFCVQQVRIDALEHLLYGDETSVKEVTNRIESEFKNER